MSTQLRRLEALPMVSFPSEALTFCNRSHQWSLCHPCQLGGLPPALELPPQVRADVGEWGRAQDGPREGSRDGQVSVSENRG